MAHQGVRVVTAEGFTYAEMVSAIERTGGRFVDLVRSLDASDAALPVPGLEWTVAQTAAHLIGIVMRGTGDRRRAPTVDRLGELNLLQITEIGLANPAEIADALEQRLSRQLAQLRRATGEEPFELHAGLFATVKTALSYELWDLLIHGYDIARPTGRPWAIDPADAALDLVAVLPALEPWLRDDVRTGAPAQVRFSFAGVPHSVVVQAGDGSYRVHLDTEVSRQLDPVEMLLALSQRADASDDVARTLSSWFVPT